MVVADEETVVAKLVGADDKPFVEFMPTKEGRPVGTSTETPNVAGALSCSLAATETAWIARAATAAAHLGERDLRPVQPQDSK